LDLVNFPLGISKPLYYYLEREDNFLGGRQNREEEKPSDARCLEAGEERMKEL